MHISLFYISLRTGWNHSADALGLQVIPGTTVFCFVYFSLLVTVYWESDCYNNKNNLFHWIQSVSLRRSLQSQWTDRQTKSCHSLRTGSLSTRHDTTARRIIYTRSTHETTGLFTFIRVFRASYTVVSKYKTYVKFSKC